MNEGTHQKFFDHRDIDLNKITTKDLDENDDENLKNSWVNVTKEWSIRISKISDWLIVWIIDKLIDIKNL